MISLTLFSYLTPGKGHEIRVDLQQMRDGFVLLLLVRISKLEFQRFEQVRARIQLRNQREHQFLKTGDVRRNVDVHLKVKFQVNLSFETGSSS